MFSMHCLAFGLLVGLLSAQEDIKPAVEVITEHSFVNGDGYNFEFQTSDGTSRKEEGSLITVGDAQGIGIKGSYSYIAPDGQQYEVTFTADDKGYNPQVRIIPPGTQ